MSALQWAVYTLLCCIAWCASAADHRVPENHRHLQTATVYRKTFAVDHDPARDPPYVASTCTGDTVGYPGLYQEGGIDWMATARLGGRGGSEYVCPVVATNTDEMLYVCDAAQQIFSQVLFEAGTTNCSAADDVASLPHCIKDYRPLAKGYRRIAMNMPCILPNYGTGGRPLGECISTSAMAEDGSGVIPSTAYMYSAVENVKFTCPTTHAPSDTGGRHRESTTTEGMWSAVTSFTVGSVAASAVTSAILTTIEDKLVSWLWNNVDTTFTAAHVTLTVGTDNVAATIIAERTSIKDRLVAAFNGMTPAAATTLVDVPSVTVSAVAPVTVSEYMAPPPAPPSPPFSIDCTDSDACKALVGMATGLLVVVIVVPIIAVILLILLIYCCCCKKKRPVPGGNGI